MPKPTWHARLSEEQKRDLPPKSGETMKHYAARWIGHVNRGGQMTFSKAWHDRNEQ